MHTCVMFGHLKRFFTVHWVTLCSVFFHHCNNDAGSFSNNNNAQKLFFSVLIFIVVFIMNRCLLFAFHFWLMCTSMVNI